MRSLVLSTRLLAVLLFLLLAGCGPKSAPAPQQPAQAEEAVSVQFGLFQEQGNDTRVFYKAATRIPFHQEGDDYSFGVKITNRGLTPVTWAVRIVLAGDFVVGESLVDGYKVDKAAHTVESVPEVLKAGRWAYKTYFFEPGDPLGDYTCVVLVDGKEYRTIPFTVVEKK